MAPEDRDRNFDKALSRHLRADSGSGAAGELRPDALTGNPSCLDPEMLAAYHERTLLPEEMNAAKEHIVSCGRCQSILAQLEMTDAVPLVPAAGQEEKVLAAVPQKARAPIPIRGARWAWLVPAGALAASLLVWVGMHENRRQSALSHESEVKMAKVQEPASPPPAPATRQAPASPSTDQISTLSENAREEASGAIGGAAKGERAKEVESLKQLYAPQPNAKVAVHASKSGAGVAGTDKELRKDANSLRDSAVALAKPADNKADLDEKTATQHLSEEAQVQAQAANIQTQNQMALQKVPGPAPLGQANSTKKAKPDSGAIYRAAAPPAAAPAQAPAESAPVAGFASSALETVAITNPHLISAPGTNFVWRAGRAGLIEFSSDGGAKWSRQTSGVLTDLTTGASPSANVCWMVGRVGTILLTVDGGAHWTLLHAPLSEDLGGIRAADALHATIWNARNTKSFETADSGVTWTPVPAP